MHINPILVGVFITLFTEAIMLIVGSLLTYFDSKGENENGKDNNNQSNQQNQHKD